jgi:alanine transaminase
LQLAELELSLSKAKSLGVDVRALAVINPGNPTGQCLTIESMKEVRDEPAGPFSLILV